MRNAVGQLAAQAWGRLIQLVPAHGEGISGLYDSFCERHDRKYEGISDLYGSSGVQWPLTVFDAQRGRTVRSASVGMLKSGCASLRPTRKRARLSSTWQLVRTA